MDWFFTFPQISPEFLLSAKRLIDGSLKVFTRAYGQTIEGFFYPLSRVLIFFENALSSAPWPLVVLAFGALGWFASRRWTIVAGIALTLIVIGLLGLWRDTMMTVSLVLTATIFSIAAGIPLGIVMNRYSRIGAFTKGILDVMQTMPPFVYLIPVVMLLGIGRVRASSPSSSTPSRRSSA